MNIEHILPEEEQIQGYDITLGIDVSKLPTTLSNNNYYKSFY
jgi:hypothetical protein